MNGEIKTLDGRVYDQVEKKIISGEYKVGEQITEMRISKELGVSRTPVREALAMLERDGLIEIIPNKGARVCGVSENDLIDIYKIRQRLEGLCASLASQRINEEGIHNLEEIIELSEFYMMKNNHEKLKELDTDFHQCIYKHSGSRMISKILSDLHRSIGYYRKLSLQNPQRLDNSVKEHKEILEAIKNKDALKADELAAHHAESALENLTTLIDMR